MRELHEEIEGRERWAESRLRREQNQRADLQRQVVGLKQALEAQRGVAAQATAAGREEEGRAAALPGVLINLRAGWCRG